MRIIMSVIHSWEIDEEIERLTGKTAVQARAMGYYWFEVLGRLPLEDYEGRSRVTRMLNAIDDHITAHSRDGNPS
jgi:hypothetical protein